ncbi:MAG: ribosomal protein S18-alanine N-acetyltransferase [Lactobacillales bacterium]|jgi:ribosomal-protein-alanine N-acetyltransferase|nr:ribosomal protein S18-alanine N-acetyltransferase [Lactobacillales bacterium]
MIVEKNGLANAYTLEELATKIWEVSDSAYDTGAPWTIQQFIHDLENVNAFYLIALSEDKIVGFISYSYVLDEAEITNFAVQAQFKGQGLGKKLMKKLIERLQTQGVNQVFLEVRKSNKIAQNIYESYSFQPISVRKKYYQYPEEDALIMRLEWQ